MIVHCPKCTALIRDGVDSCPSCHEEFSEADKESIQKEIAEAAVKTTESVKREKKAINVSLVFSLIEALAVALTVAIIGCNSVNNYICAAEGSWLFYDGYATFDFDIQSSDGNTIYPAGTRIKIRAFTGSSGSIIFDNHFISSHSYDIGDTSNKEELTAAFNELTDERNQEYLHRDAGVIAVSAVIAIVAYLIFSVINGKLRTTGRIILFVAVTSLSVINTLTLRSYFSRALAPIIYLYPEEETTVNVRLSLNGELTTTYPLYDEDLGWTVTASPDGTLTDDSGREYNYLFWEGNLAIKPDLSHGYCVKGKDTAAFLEEALAQLGLNDSEANTFIMYWLPQMESNEYNVITFQTYAYEDVASLEITPDPDTVIRVNMLWFPTSSYVDMEPQDLPSLNPSEREGFTVVEWGGEKYERGALSLIFR